MGQDRSKSQRAAKTASDTAGDYCSARGRNDFHQIVAS